MELDEISWLLKQKNVHSEWASIKSSYFSIFSIVSFLLMKSATLNPQSIFLEEPRQHGEFEEQILELLNHHSDSYQG